MRRVAVVGVGQIPFQARCAEKTYLALAYEATKRALEDAHVEVKDLDAVTYAIYCPIYMRQEQPDIFLHDYLGMGGKPSLRISAGAATGGCAMYAAFNQVASGMADILLLVAVQKASDPYDFYTKSRWDGYRKTSMSGEMTWQKGVIAAGPVPISTVACVLPHMEKYECPTEEQIAKVSVKNHQNALANPNAQLKVNLTVEDVLNSRIIAWPITMYECCLYSDGAAALILASEEKAKAMTDTPIWITGVTTSYYSLHRLEPYMLGRMLGVAEAAKRAYEQAGVKDPLNELDVIELQDLTSGLEIIAYEELGLCPLGEGGKLVDEGIVYKDGKLPVNPRGGCVACGHVAGVCEVSSMGDVVLQLQERAGPIQVPIRKGRGLVETICGVASMSSVTIFERKD
jgi:acetyl-CoA C-acetyltransferase